MKLLSYLLLPTGGDDLKACIAQSIEHHYGRGLHLHPVLRGLLARRVGEVHRELALKIDFIE